MLEDMRPLLLLALTLAFVPSAFAAAPTSRSLAGTVTANTASSITVSAARRSLSCSVLGAKAQAAVQRWGVGLHATMTCRRTGGRLVLSHLAKTGTPGAATVGAPGAPTVETPPTSSTTTPPAATGARDARGTVTALGGGSITVTRDNGTSVTCSLSAGQQGALLYVYPVGRGVYIVCNAAGALVSATDPNAGGVVADPGGLPDAPPAGSTPAAPAQRDAHGVVTALSADAVTVRPDAGGDSLRCSITGAADSAAARTKLTPGAHVAIVCRRDGDHYVLSGATPITG